MNSRSTPGSRSRGERSRSIRIMAGRHHSIPSAGPARDTISRWFDTSVFGRPARGDVGNGHKDIIRLPGVNNTDITLFKRDMTTTIVSLTHITDGELLTAVAQAATQERSATAHLIALLAELDSRRLYLGEGCSSLFTYCTQVLHLSEHAAYGRIEAARRARRLPIVLEMLAEGAITLTRPTGPMS
jgi:hypothetical protein